MLPVHDYAAISPKRAIVLLTELRAQLNFRKIKVTSAKSSRGQSSPQKTWSTIAPYAVLSLGSFLFFLLLLALLLWNAERLVALGLTGNLYYLVLVPLGLSAAAFLFGALRSYAQYRGKQLGGVLELGGPVVLFLLVLILGFWLPKPASNFPLTVYVHGPGGPQDLVLRGSGYIMLDIGGERKKRPIGNDGEVVFSEIPANFRGQEVPIALDADGYELVDAYQKANLTESSVYVEVRKKPARITGYVHDDEGKLLATVNIVVAGFTASTNQDGYFELVLPGEQLQPSLTLKAVAPGFEPWSDTVVPNSNDVTITLHRQQ